MIPKLDWFFVTHGIPRVYIICELKPTLPDLPPVGGSKVSIYSEHSERSKRSYLYILMKGLIIIALLIYTEGTVNRSERLSWFRFGEFVKNEQVNNYTFIYDDNENVESVWEGMTL